MSEIEFPPHVEPVLKELARRIELSKHTPKTPIKINQDSSIDFRSLVEALGDIKGLDLTTVNVGDVVWWRDEEGLIGLMKVTKPYAWKTKDNPVGTYGHGFVRLGEPDGTEYIKRGHINGALFGGAALKLFQIVRGFPLEVTYRMKDKDVIPYTYTSGNIADYGVISKEDSLK